MVLMMSGCGSNGSNNTEDTSGNTVAEEVPYEEVSLEEVPENVAASVRSKTFEESTFTVPDGDSLYIIVTRGEMPTGGYSVAFTSLEKKGKELFAQYKYKNPGKDDMVTQVISKPVAIIKIDKTNARVNFKQVK
ncbi:protease complex subunit PrcB family protein [Pseudalkalibacillus caeni]|uniref:Protease complex subunit PrcB family protein n=1 Tax=Exobacillus caeni TaxID=2574798 RepID=A0A5R9FAJ6_9BACL|nr:protease complex subunit PrcB family protein [Pseudalkalibacillus caeni]TLS37893.1 protease complex subunit PrcB family protein [Pseudalkalibacillus caeni]